MKEIVVIRGDEVKRQSLPGSGGEEAGWMKRIVYPPNVISKGTFMGTAEVNPGYSPHRWHNHTSDKSQNYEVVYPENFEEIYHILSGRGVVQWKTEGGEVREEKVGPGDTVFFPAGVGLHQLLNDGKEKIVMVFCGSPTARVTIKQS
jgi:oxalate decarboxylase/phosphoglucose isomerase-like protein (cupin superfamily)